MSFNNNSNAAEPEADKPVAWGHPNTAITGKKQPLMMVNLEIPSNAQYPQLWVPLYLHPPEPIEPEADDILDRAITALESTRLEITNITAFRDRVIDECIEAVGLGICRDGRNTSHYQQSQRHLEALRKLKTRPEPARKPLSDVEIADIYYSETEIPEGHLFAFAEGFRQAENHHNIK